MKQNWSTGIPVREIHRSLAQSFVTTIWWKKSEPTAQVREQSESRATAPVMAPVTPPVTPPVAVVVLIRLISSTVPLGNSEILANFDLSGRTHLRESYIDPALADGLVERTIPEKPTSRFQKYRLTEKGRRLLELLDKDGGRS